MINIPRMIESTKANNLLTEIDVKLISIRFILFGSLNRCLAKVFLFIPLDNHLKQSIVSSNICLCELPDDMCGHCGNSTNLLTLKLRGLICDQVKIHLFEKIPPVSNTYTVPIEDTCKPSSSLKVTTINRLKSRKKIERGAKEQRYRNNIFIQAYNQVCLCNRKDLARNFVAKLNDEQEQTFNVKLYGECIQDQSGTYRETFNEIILQLCVFGKISHIEEIDAAVTRKYEAIKEFGNKNSNSNGVQIIISTKHANSCSNNRTKQLE